MKLITLLFIFFSSCLWAETKLPTLKIIQLFDDVYQHVSYKKVEPYGVVAASGLIVIEGDEAHVIDTPWTKQDTKKIIEWAELKGLEVKSAVITHFHEDASGGIATLNNLKIKTFATRLTNRLLKLNDLVQASDEITTENVQLFNGLIEVYYPGLGHTQDNIVVWLAKNEILFGGCFVKSLGSKSLGNINDAAIAEWPLSIQKVKYKYSNIKVVVPGHGKVGDKHLLSHTEQLAIFANKRNTSL